MDRPTQVSLFFCEDIRMEKGDKPFIIGLLSPVIYAQLDGKEEFAYLVTSVQSHSREEVLLDLEITITAPGRDAVRIERQRRIPAEISDDGVEIRDEPWKAWIPLPLGIPECIPGTKVLAEFKGEGIYAWASLLVRAAANADE